MPYIIAIIVIAIVGVAYALLQGTPADTIAETQNTEVRIEETEPATTQTAIIADTESNPASVSELVETPDDTAVEPSALADGEYSATASYFTPKRDEHTMEVTLSVVNGIITDANITYDGTTAQTPIHKAFDAAYKTEVIGEPIATVELSRVGGASLTSNSFNEAVATIRQEA